MTLNIWFSPSSTLGLQVCTTTPGAGNGTHDLLEYQLSPTPTSEFTMENLRGFQGFLLLTCLPNTAIQEGNGPGTPHAALQMTVKSGQH